MARLGLLLSLLLSACSALGSDTETLRLYVDAQTVECIGEAVQECLQVREAPEADVEWLYEGIEGYTHEPGVAAVLDVEVQTIADPPADGSSRLYRLLRVVSRTPGG